MRNLSAITLLIAATPLAGCSRAQDQPAADTAAATTQAAISLAALAGRWRMRSISETGDTTLASYELVATADTTGWTLIIPDRPPVPVRVSIVGDSIKTEGDPFESTLRKGVQVTLTGVLHLEGDKLLGTTVAHFRGSGPDSVLQVRTEGTRAQ